MVDERWTPGVRSRRAPASGGSMQRLRRSLAAAGATGRFADGDVPASVEALLDRGDALAALDALGAAAAGDQDPVFWVHLHMAAVELGLEDRAVDYRRRQRDRWPEERFSLLRRVAAGATTADEAVETLVRACEQRRPHPHWAVLRSLDFATDAAHVARWVAGTLDADPPCDGVTHLWFGLGDSGDRLYVAGLARHPFTTPAPPVTWSPASLEGPATVLAEVVRIAETDPDGLGNDAAFPLCLGYASVAVRLGLEPWFATGRAGEHHPPRTVLTGFDSGDHLVVGTLTSSGLRPPPRGLDRS